jgi:hypothetical protein
MRYSGAYIKPLSTEARERQRIWAPWEEHALGEMVDGFIQRAEKMELPADD